MNPSELSFERFCDTCGIPVSPLKPDGDRTPDFVIRVGGTDVVVEVKELTANEDERRALEQLRIKGSVSWGSGPAGKRVRYKIDDAKRQLERFAELGNPTLLVLYDARPIPVSGIYPYEVLVGMYGMDTLDIAVPQAPGKPMRIVGRRFGKGRKLGLESHTGISGVGVLRPADSGGGQVLDVYVNVFARYALPLAALAARANVAVFTLPNPSSGAFQDWVRIGNGES
jgi:hypothetical protein